MSDRLAEALAVFENHRRTTERTEVSLFDEPSLASKDPNPAIASVAETWRGEVTVRLERIVDELARARPTFTTDDIADAVPADLNGVDLRVLGVIVRAAAKRRIIRAGPYVPSRRRHNSPIRQWESLIYDGGNQ